MNPLQTIGTHQTIGSIPHRSSSNLASPSVPTASLPGVGDPGEGRSKERREDMEMMNSGVKRISLCVEV